MAFRLPPTPRSIGAGAREGEAAWRYQDAEDGSLRVQMPLEAAAQEAALTRSLRIGSDDRYRRMDHYRGNGREHFARLLKRESTSVQHGLRKSVLNDVSKLPAIESASEQELAERLGIGGRASWQDEFDRSVRRLFVDFELSDVPSCRLNHLDRMHDWFVQHGAKQQRITNEGPSFLVADRNLEAPVGSTRNIPVKPVDRPLATGFTSATLGTPRRQRLVPPLTGR